MLHGGPDQLSDTPLPYTRITLLVNIWLDHHPGAATPLSAPLLGILAGSTPEPTQHVHQQRLLNVRPEGAVPAEEIQFCPLNGSQLSRFSVDRGAAEHGLVQRSAISSGSKARLQMQLPSIAALEQLRSDDKLLVLELTSECKLIQDNREAEKDDFFDDYHGQRCNQAFIGN